MNTKNYFSTLLLVAAISMSQLFAQTTVCPTPTGLTSTNITFNSATVGWVSTTATGVYNVRYRTSPSPNNVWLTMTVTNTFANLTGLAALTTYEYQVQKVCSNSGGAASISPFSPSSYFTTLGISNACPIPVGLFANNITTNSAKVNWGSTNASSYKVRYRVAGSLAWTTVNAANNFKNLAGLTALTTYQWQVRSICITPAGAIVKSPFSPTASFTTLGVNACPTPTGLTAAISAGGVALTWNSTGAISYNIRYKPANTAAWTNTTSSTNSKVLSGLLSNGSYEWQVQGACSNGSGAIVLSAWSASAFFTYPSPVIVNPNPADSKITVSYPSLSKQDVSVSICDFYNTVYTSDKKSATEGSNQFEMNVSNLKNGIYYLQLTGAEGNQTIKFYVQH